MLTDATYIVYLNDMASPYMETKTLDFRQRYLKPNNEAMAMDITHEEKNDYSAFLSVPRTLGEILDHFSGMEDQLHELTKWMNASKMKETCYNSLHETHVRAYHALKVREDLSRERDNDAYIQKRLQPIKSVSKSSH